jgi:hypothetical protein
MATWAAAVLCTELENRVGIGPRSSLEIMFSKKSPASSKQPIPVPITTASFLVESAV